MRRIFVFAFIELAWLSSTALAQDSSSKAVSICEIMKDPAYYNGRELILDAKYSGGLGHGDFLESGVCPQSSDTTLLVGGQTSWRLRLNYPAHVRFDGVRRERGDADIWATVVAIFLKEPDFLGSQILVKKVESMRIVVDPTLSVCEVLTKAKEFDGKHVKVRGEFVATPNGGFVRAYKCSVKFRLKGKLMPPAVAVAWSDSDVHLGWEPQVWATDNARNRLEATAEGVFEMALGPTGFGENGLFGARVRGELHHTWGILAGQ
jgi:hypothetical protein